MKIRLSRIVLVTLILVICRYGSAATISYKQVSIDSFQLTLKNEIPLEIKNAQSTLYPLAAQLCGNKAPIFGKYTFDSSEPLLNEAGKSSFKLIQEIECGKESHTVQEQVANSLSESDKVAMSSQAKRLTEDFFASKEAGKFEEAYNFLGEEMKGLDEYSVWEDRESSKFGESIGGLLAREFWKITVYDNPVNSPKPGVYIAVDYESSYEKLPTECGFVIWYTSNEKPLAFTIMRQESGRITDENVAKMTKENLNGIRSQIGCRDKSG